MLRTRLLAAAATAALLVAPAALAQTAPAPVPEQPPVPATPATPPAAAQAAAAPTPVQADNVIDVLTARGDFTTLLAALDKAQLTDTLRQRPAISIFAPTDEAFAALPEAERTRLMDPANAAELRQLLLYHVIVADVSSAQIEGARGGVETASRTQVLLDGTGDAIKVDGATVTQADIDASNGSIFAIDKVLNPAESMAAMGDEEAVAPAAPADEVTPAEDAAPPASADESAPAEDAVPPADAVDTVPPVTPPAEAGVTETLTPPEPGQNAPNGQPAVSSTTVASPPVANPTDGQVDAQPDPARATPPVQTPDPADGEEDGTEPASPPGV